jgi:hypothetical protein
MRRAERLLWAFLFIVVDAAAFALPLAALLIAYVLLARPAWFRDWVERLYQDAPRSAGCRARSRPAPRRRSD